MALLTAQTPTPSAGLVPVYGAANASDTFNVFGPGVFLYVKNTNASTRTITLTTPNAYRGLAVADPGPTIAATTGELILGPLMQDLYMDPSTGVGTVTPSATPGVTLALVSLQVS